MDERENFLTNTNCIKVKINHSFIYIYILQVYRGKLSLFNCSKMNDRLAQGAFTVGWEKNILTPAHLTFWTCNRKNTYILFGLVIISDMYITLPSSIKNILSLTFGMLEQLE